MNSAEAFAAIALAAVACDGSLGRDEAHALRTQLEYRSWYSSSTEADMGDLFDRLLHRLRDHGNTIIVIEHNLDVIKTADWIIDLGPEGGSGGGLVVGEGTPEDLAKNSNSFTGKFLRPLLDSRSK